MEYQALPFDTASFDDLPFSAFIYEPVTDTDGAVYDYRIVYGNRKFTAQWNRLYGQERPFAHILLKENHMIDDGILHILNGFRTEAPRAFSRYMETFRIHLHFEPMSGLPAPYAGFFVTDISGYEEQDAKAHFLNAIVQMNGNSVLMRRHDSGKLECVYVSEAFANMMECSPDEALKMMDGLKFFKSTHPDDRPFVRSMLKRRVADDGTSDLTIQKVTAKRQKIWCRVHYAFIDDFGEHYIFCTYTDVTMLKKYEERLRSVYVSLGNNFYQINEHTLGLLRVNLTRNVIEEVKGRGLYPADSTRYPYSEAMSRRAVNYPIERERKHFLQVFHRERLMAGYLEGKVSVSEILCSRRPDGNICYVRFAATLTRHPLSGDMIAFITEEECNGGKTRDMLISKILGRQFDMVAYLVNGNYGVTIGDAKQIRYGNLFPRTLRGDYQTYLQEQIEPVLWGDEEECGRMMNALSLETVAEQTRTQEPYVVNVAICQDKKIYYKRFDFYSVDPEAEFYIVLKSDTTELQQKQSARNEQLRAALAEAQQANVAKTAFLSSMSHEIRTPMNAIIGLDNIALKDSSLSPHSREQLEKIGVSARHLLGLINDILDMSRIESGRMVLKNEEFSFREFLEQINTLVSSQCQERGLQYDCVISGEMDDYYIGDNMKLKQVLINVLGNAVKFTPAPGSVTFTVACTAKFADQSTLRFVIKDTGIGMDREYLPKIFEAFSQEDATSTNRYGGSGLGMAITKNIVEMMNGNISVQSEKGTGSEFTVNVTLRNSSRTEDGSASGLNPQDIHALIVDDDPVACEHAKIVLEETGISVETCPGGQEALELIQLRHARRQDYNLFLLDLRMPEQNGIELAREIRRQDGGDLAAIILLTAYSWEEWEAEAVEAGVDSFMSKPLFAANVLYEFRQAVARKSATQKKKKQPVDLTGRRILLAEDMAINAEIMMELLDMREIKAEHAENGQLAVELFQKRPEGYFDAILMDVRMPVMDGLQAAAAIRALDRPDAKTIPIIAMTANAFDEDVQRSLQAGMDAHLSKPVEPERLFATLAEMIHD